ncbi:unnamed protein product [Candida verbasci]|uniref:CTP-dependent diacylglycerol kinase 1 n=1 Tax=Candida verbasci TaxID=1227364 RepID=A0A9W4TRG9_9ASCO|nr:unnamed protein product [Candida verbasci]
MKDPIVPTTSKVSDPLKKEINPTFFKFDPNHSYSEEDDKTYVYNSSQISIDEEEIEEEEEEVIEDTDDTSIDKTIEIEQKSVEVKQVTVRQFLTKHEIPRKVFHSSIGILTLYLYTQGVKIPQLFIPLFTAFMGVLINDLIRLNNPEINKIVTKYMWFIIRDKEINSYNGTLYYLAGVLIVLYLYPKDISVLSILLLSWADTSASTFGRMYGKYTFQIGKGKSFAGSLASCITGIITSYIFYGYFIPNYNVNQPGDIYWSQDSSYLSIHIYSIVVGLVASFSEFIDFFNIDDNFTIPVLSGTLLCLIVGWAHK